MLFHLFNVYLRHIFTDITCNNSSNFFLHSESIYKTFKVLLNHMKGLTEISCNCLDKMQAGRNKYYMYMGVGGTPVLPQSQIRGNKNLKKIMVA